MALIISEPLPHGDAIRLNWATLVHMLQERGSAGKAVWVNKNGAWHAEFRDVDERVGTEIAHYFASHNWLPSARWES